MLGASFLPSRLRHEHNHAAPSKPGYLNQQITRLLQVVARGAFQHPIHTIVFVALLASTSYVGSLESSLFNRSSLGQDAGNTDIHSLVEGARSLRIGQETSWKWQAVNGGSEDTVAPRESSHAGYWKPLVGTHDHHLMVMTLVFPDSLSNSSPWTAPSTDEVSIPRNSSVKQLPSTWNPLSPISQDTALAFSVPSVEAVEFLDTIQELPNNGGSSDLMYSDGSTPNPGRWVMRNAKYADPEARSTLRLSVKNTWNGFIDLLKVWCPNLMCKTLLLIADRMRNL